MQTRLSLLLVAASMLALSGCSRSSHQTVEWYMEHKDEREAKRKWCQNDMARAAEVDCMNAEKAFERVLLTSKESAADTFEYKLPEERAAAGPQPGPAAPAPADKPAAAEDTFKFDPNKVPKGAD